MQDIPRNGKFGHFEIAFEQRKMRGFEVINQLLFEHNKITGTFFGCLSIIRRGVTKLQYNSCNNAFLKSLQWCLFSPQHLRLRC